MKTVLNLTTATRLTTRPTPVPTTGRLRAPRRATERAGRIALAAAAVVGAMLAGAPAGPAAAQEAVWSERSVYLMGTVLEARVAARDRETGMAVLEEVFREVTRLEGVLSSWSAESELGRLNGAPEGVEVPVSGELWRLLIEAVGWWERTEGAFDPGIGALVDAWDLRGAGRRPGPEALSSALAASGLEHYRVSEDAPRVTRLVAGGWLDTGAFGKGAALRSAGEVLRRRGIESAYLDFGGQILVLGSPAEGDDGWEIRVAHPSDREATVAGVRLREGSVATSSQSERFVEVGSERFGHVLDPRSGRPVPGGRSVTVIARDPLVADVLATALLVMGPEEGGRWAAELDEVGVLFLVEGDAGVVPSSNAAFERYRDQSRSQQLDDSKR